MHPFRRFKGMLVMSWDLFVMDLPPDATSAHAIPPGWIPRPLPAREDIIRTVLQVDSTADTSDPAWVRVNGPGFSVEINIADKTPLTEFACHVRGGDLAVGFIATLLDRLQLRALDPGSASGLFDPATAPDSQARWRRHRDQVVVGQELAGTKPKSGIGFPFTVVARLAESLQPVVRGARYEDPLGAALNQQQCGRVVGGGTQLNERMETDFIDVELALADLDGALAVARATLASLDAPVGSTLHFMREGKPRALPISGDGLEFDSPETLLALGRRLVPTPKPAGSTNYDTAVIKATAAKLLANFERLFVPASETILVDASLCDHAIQAWYDKVTRDLEVEGFQALGDFTSASTMAARKGQRPPVFSRKFLSADRKIRATAIYMLAAKSGQPNTQIIGLNSEFNVGRFLRTTNTIEKWDTPDQLFVENLPRETSPTALAGRHRARVAFHIASNPDATVVVMQSLQDVFDSESRSQLLTSAFRRRRGIPSIDELVRFGIARQLAQLVHHEMQETKRSAL
jgi:hypothetical protein